MVPVRQRVDKWLWFARMTKSRTLAAGLVAAGQVRVNRAKVSKPSHEVGAGDVLTVAAQGSVRVLRVVACGHRRGPAAEARLLYELIESSNDGSDAKNAAE